MACCGLPEWLAYCIKHPGRSRYELACQGSELMIGLGKMFCKKCGTGKWNMPDLLVDFFDLTGTCMVHNNQVDFYKILKRLKDEQLLIFDPMKTPLIESSIETCMAPLMKYIVQILESWEIGDAVHPFLAQILNALTLDINALQLSKIQAILANKQPHNDENREDIDIWDEEYTQILDQMEEINDKFLQQQSVKTSLRVAAAVVNDEILE